MTKIVDLGEVENVLVVKPSSLGDIVHTLPAVALLKRAHPHLRIRWVVNEEWAPLLHDNPHVESVIPFPRRRLRGFMGMIRFFNWAAGMRRDGVPDLALDFQGLLRSAMIAKRSGAPVIVGMSDAREGAGALYGHRVDVEAGAHAVDRYLRVPEALGVAIEAPLEFPLPEGERMEGLPEQFVAIHPFSRGDGKALTRDQTERLAHGLGPSEVVVIGREEGHLPLAGDGLLDLTNRTSIAQLITVLRRARFVVSVDSGPMHLAAAAARGLLAIHTWSDPAKVGPYRPDALVWKGGRLVEGAQALAGGAPTGEAGLDDAALDAIAAVVRERLAS